MAVELRLSPGECALCRRLAGGAEPLDADAAAAARRHRLHLVLASLLDAGERRQPWSLDLVRELHVAAAMDVRREAALRELLDAFAAASVDALILKGAAFAHTLYPASYLRPRSDVDLLVERDRVGAAEAGLVSCGWRRDVEPDHELAAAQRHYTRARGEHAPDRIDLHWRLVNPLALADPLTFATLQARAVAIPALGPAARTPCRADALAHACLHLTAHHADESPSLLWLYDVHLLATTLDADERRDFLRVADHPALRGACRHVLGLAASAFGSPAAASLAGALPPGGEPTAGTMLTRTWADLAALPTWRSRLVLAREHLFPSMAYIRSRYPTWPVPLLPVAVLYRIVRGAPKWLRGPR